MSDVAVRYIIEGKDQNSKQIFNQVTSNADSAATRLQSAASRMSSAFSSIGSAAARMNISLSDVAMRGLAAITQQSLAGQAAQAKIKQAIEDTGGAWEDYASQIGKAANKANDMGFSDNQLRDAMATLIAETHDVNLALNEQGLIMDLARARHMSLERAANLVGQAFNGNVGMLRRYGIMLDAGTSGSEALLQLQQRVSGQAQAFADTNAGELAMLHEKWKNLEGIVGDHLGQLQLLTASLPGMRIGYDIVRGGVGLLTDQLNKMREAAEAAKTAELSMAEAQAFMQSSATVRAPATMAGTAGIGTGMASIGAGEAAMAESEGEAILAGSFFGPAGIIAAIAAAGLAMLALTEHTDNFRTAAQAAAEDTNKLAAAIATLQAGGGSPQQVASLKSVVDEWTALDAAQAKYNNDLKLVQQQQGNVNLFGVPEGALSPAMLAQKRAVQQAQIDLQTIDKAYQAINESQENAINAEIPKIFAHPGVDPTKAQAAIDALFKSFQAGTIDAEGLVKGIDDLNTQWTQLTNNASTADAATNALIDSLTKYTGDAKDAWTKLVDPLKEVPDLLKHIDSSFDPAAQGIQHSADLIGQQYVAALNAANGDQEKIKAATDEYVKTLYFLSDALTKAETSTAAADSNMAGFNQTLDYMGIAADEAGNSLDIIRKYLTLPDFGSGIHYGLAGYISDVGDQADRTVVRLNGLFGAVQRVDTIMAVTPQTPIDMGVAHHDVVAPVQSGASQAGPAVEMIDAITRSHQSAADSAQQVADAWNHVTNAIERANGGIGDMTRNTDTERDNLMQTMEGYIKLLGQEETFAQTIANYQYKSGQIPMYGNIGLPTDQGAYASSTGRMGGNIPAGLAGASGGSPSLQTSDAILKPLQNLLDLPGMFQKVHEMYEQGRLTQQEYESAQMAFSGTLTKTKDWVSTTQSLLDKLVNVKGVYGGIDDMLAAGLITHKQWVQAQKDYDAETEKLHPFNAQLVSDLQFINDQLATGTRVVIDNTQAIADNSDKLNKWATDLIGPAGTYAKIDDLLAAGKITIDEWNSAQDAGTRIMADNVRVQQDVQTIQAKQAPLLADIADAQADYMDQLSKQPAKQQMASLALMDSTEQQKAQTVVALAAAAAQGKVGTAAQDAADAVIQGATDADPYLKELLLQIGLATEDKHGEVHINLDGAETVQTALDNVNNTMQNLLNLFKHPIKVTIITPDPEWQDFTNHVDSFTRGNHDLTVHAGVHGQPEVDAMKSALENMPTTRNPAVTAHVYGADAVDALAGGIASLTGKDIYINTYETSYQQTIDYGRNQARLGGVLNFALGGIPSFASGGVARLAEAGPELVDTPFGRLMALNDGYYRVPNHSYVHTAPASKLMKVPDGGPSYHHHGNVYNYPGSSQAALATADRFLSMDRRA